MSKKELVVKVEAVKALKKDVFLLKFTSPFIAQNAHPGMFIHVKIPQTILRRPLSIHKVNGVHVFLLFRVRGKGTKVLSQCKQGDKLNILGPLGKGFKYDRQRATSNLRILLAGGLGVAPLMFLAQELKKQTQDKKQKGVVLLGAKSKNELLCEAEFKNLGYKVYVATDDGSKGLKGSVIDLLKKLLTPYPFPSPQCSIQAGPPMAEPLNADIYACGPEEMFKGIFNIIKNKPGFSAQVSFEQFMGCGLGICCGCTIETKDGYKKVCHDGPVFNLENIY